MPELTDDNRCSSCNRAVDLSQEERELYQQIGSVTVSCPHCGTETLFIEDTRPYVFDWGSIAGQIAAAKDSGAAHLQAEIETLTRENEQLRAELHQRERDLAAARQRIAELETQLGQALAAADRSGQGIGASVGGDVSGEMVVAGRDVIKASPGELRECPACGGEGRFVRTEDGERLIILCDRCNGLGQIRL